MNRIERASARLPVRIPSPATVPIGTCPLILSTTLDTGRLTPMRRNSARRIFAAMLAAATAGAGISPSGMIPTYAQQPSNQSLFAQQLSAQQGPTRRVSAQPQLQKLNVPPASVRTVANQLNARYRTDPSVTITPDPRNAQVVVLAPADQHSRIAGEVLSLVNESIKQVSADLQGPLQVRLAHVTWREFEDGLAQVTPGNLPVTTSHNGERASFQLTAAPMTGTTVQVDRRANAVTVLAPEPAIPGWRKLISVIDSQRRQPGEVSQLMRLENADAAPIQRALRLLREVEQAGERNIAAVQVDGRSPFRNAVFQSASAQNQSSQGGGADNGNANAGGDTDTADDSETGSGPAGDVEIQFIPELGQVIITGSKKDVERVKQIIADIERKAAITQPAVEVKRLDHADSNAVAQLLNQLYDDVLSSRQGEVSITSLDNPNALLLIGREEAIASVLELIAKIDMPIDERDQLQVFRLQHASAVDAQDTIQDYFVEQPGESDDPRPGLGTRVRVLADYRTNSLIVNASPRDMVEVKRLINQLDVLQIASQSEIRTFPLNNALAEDLAQTLNDVITAADDDGQITTPSATLSIVRLGSNGTEQFDSGILAGAVITADANANAIVVKAPSASMALIGELIDQLDQAPGIESLVKVFTLQNSDAQQLTTALQSLFGTDAATAGTSVGAGNLQGLSQTTAADSALTPLRFSPDLRSNSIIVSGSAEDLEVVESLLIRLDSEGFAERITEVIWLRHQVAQNVALALQDYIAQRQQGRNQIQQFQTGLAVYDLPDRDLIVAAEAQTNSLIISVAPRLYEDVRRLIDQLDRRPPMVMIKTVVAQVTLSDTFEIGGELGLQDSLLYDRDITNGALGAPPPYASNGFNFNNTNLPNVDVISPGKVAARGVTAFGVGTTSTADGVGGFVINAASESVNLLFRTLQTASRLQVLSRPNITTLDNTLGRVQVGRTIFQPVGIVQNTFSNTLDIQPLEVGLILEATPRVGADGLINIQLVVIDSDRVDGEGTLLPVGDGSAVLVEDIAKTEAITEIVAYDGQTVVFGGLIRKTRSNESRRVPYVSNLPLVGNFFKFDRETERREELLIVLTPTLINGDEDLEYIKQIESSRMSWCLADVVEMHGDVGLSHGYGLWGPAIGPTIFPDVTPTVDGVITEGRVISDQAIAPEGRVIRDSVIDEVPLRVGDGLMGDPAPVISVPDSGLTPTPAPSVPSEPMIEPLSTEIPQADGRKISELLEKQSANSVAAPARVVGFQSNAVNAAGGVTHAGGGQAEPTPKWRSVPPSTGKQGSTGTRPKATPIRLTPTASPSAANSSSEADRIPAVSPLSWVKP